MADATFVVGSFLGGEISEFAQGRFDKPDYRTSLKTCLNSFPAEIGPWTRRPGSAHAGHTRAGGIGRGMKFDFQQSDPVTVEFTDGYMRFRRGKNLVTTNDAQVVVAVSAANPAVVQTTTATTWATGNTLIFPGASTPLLENRQFLATKINSTHFSLTDAITGATINGATLGALVTGATVARVHELATSYTGGAWSAIRPVQAETTDILLSPTVAPQALTVTTQPSDVADPQFAVAAAIFNDGPYLDPVSNGAQLTPSATTGIVTLTVSFPAYSATKAYAAGAFVTSAAVNYVSLQDQNVGNVPAGSPAFWQATAASAAINGGRGFLITDIGRLIRLFSEPVAWASGTTYAVGNIVSYNPSGVAGANTYWQSLVASNTGNIPGADTKNWSLLPAQGSGSAVWTWGKVTSLLNLVPPAPAGIAYIGSMTGGGGLSAAFDSVLNKVSALSAQRQITQGFAGSSTYAYSHFVGQDFSAAVPSAYAVASVTVYPSTDLGFMRVVTSGNAGGNNIQSNAYLFLYGSNSLPASSQNGTILGSFYIGLIDIPGNNFVIKTGPPATIISSDQVTTFKYIWVTMVATFTSNNPTAFVQVTGSISQVQVVSPASSAAASAGVNVELLAASLLNTSPIATWRFGVYSNTTGWPTCGVYNDGRLYLGGAVGNRFDACVANGIDGGTINFAPTDQYGVVSPAAAISYTFNSNGVNKILWMDPDLQGIKMGTQAGEWLVKAPTAGPIAPSNIAASNVTGHGSANIAPCRTEHTLVFAQRSAKKLLEYFPDVYSGKFSAPNLADKAQHIIRAGVAELAYTSAVTPILWGRDTLGALFGITYKRDSLASAQPPTFYAWHPHRLGSGRVVESVCAGPSVGGNLDALTMVTNDAATSIRHVEILTDAPDEVTDLAAAWFLDNAVNPTSVIDTGTGLTINGLWHLNGKTVQVFAGGLDCGDPGEGKPFSDFVVSNGSLTVPYGDSISAGAGRGLFTAAFAAALPLTQIVVGFTYNSDGQIVRPILPADSGARNGPAFGKLSRSHRYAMKLVNTLGLYVGGTFARLAQANTKQDNGAPLPALTTFTGISQEGIKDDDAYDNGMCWRVSRPFPANIVVAAVNLQTKDQ
jgi:hypothetical protein